MADMDDTQEQEKKGGGLAGVTAGAGVGVLAGAGVSKLTAKPADAQAEAKAAQELKEAADKAYDTELASLKTKHATVFDAATAAETLQKDAEKGYQAAISDQWNEHIKAEGAKLETVKELRVAGLTAQKDVIGKLPKTEISDEARILATRGVDAQIASLKLPETNDVEGALKASWEKTMEAAKTEAVAAAEKKEAGTGIKAAAEFDSLSSQVSKKVETEIAKSEPVNKAFSAAAKASKDDSFKTVEATIASHENVTAAESVLKATKAPEVEAAKGAWSKIVDDATKEKLKPAQADAEKAVAKAAARVEVAESSFLKKPFKLAFKGSGKEKAAVIATSLLAAAATYAGVKAFKNRNRSDSYAEQITQERAAAAAPTADQGAARA